MRALVATCMMAVSHCFAEDPLRATLLQTTERIVDPHRAKPDRLEPSTITFNASASELPQAPTIRVSTDKVGQALVGFGGAITDAVAHVFHSMGADMQEEVLEALWGPTGQRYSMGRLPIGPTDFSLTIYSYNEHEGDFSQDNFSIAHRRASSLSLVLTIQA